jgi:uncharacterized protein (TIRG00374 family)
MTPRKKKWLFGVLRLLICVGALWIVARGVTVNDVLTPADGSPDVVGSIAESADGFTVTLPNGTTNTFLHDEVAVDENGHPRVSYGLGTAWRTSEKKYLLISVLLMIPVGVLQGVRFVWLLIAQNIRIGVWESVKLAFAGNFLNFAAPLGSTGGDVFKAYYVSLHTEHKTEAITTVFLDRVVGLLSLVIIVAALATLAPAESPLAQFRVWTLSILTAGIVGALAYLSPFLREKLVPKRLLNHLPMSDQLKRIDQAGRALAGHKSIVVAALCVTFVLQAVAMTAFFIVAVALGMRANVGNVLEYYAYFSTGAVVQALPGPPQGLGTVELAYRYFFRNYGSPSQIICMALGIRLVAFTASLPGLLVTLTGAYKPKTVTRPSSSDDAPSTPQNESEPTLLSSTSR